jgi:nucleoside-diphosphate-sugar epimerase
LIGTVLVTGAAGALGTRLLPVLRERGWRMRALVHRRPVEGADERARGDLADIGALHAAANGAEIVVHLAALTHARREGDYRTVNVAGTERLLRAAASAGVRRFVHVSTRAISPAGGGYSRSKLDAERLVEEAALEAVIVRLPEVYGAGGREGIDDILARARRGRPIPVVGKGDDLLCPVHVDDAVAALAAAVEAPGAAGNTYTLAGECRSARDVAAACAAIGGAGSRLVHVPRALVSAAALAANVLPLPLYPDQPARLRAPKPPPSPEAGDDLGFRSRPLDEGLRAAILDAPV